jgi:hypothetical protein
MHVTGQTGMFLMGVPKINNPANVERMEKHMSMLSETRSTDFRFTVTPQLRYFPDRARVSWIRTAYLAAFALLGWTYILQPALQPIREQLMNPSTITLPLLSMYDPSGDPDRHELWSIKQPTEHQSLLIISGSARCLSARPKRPEEPRRTGSQPRCSPRRAGPLRLHRRHVALAVETGAPTRSSPGHRIAVPGHVATSGRRIPIRLALYRSDH